jgi:hypothetical protein
LIIQAPETEKGDAEGVILIFLIQFSFAMIEISIFVVEILIVVVEIRILVVGGVADCGGRAASRGAGGRLRI